MPIKRWRVSWRVVLATKCSQSLGFWFGLWFWAINANHCSRAQDTPYPSTSTRLQRGKRAKITIQLLISLLWALSWDSHDKWPWPRTNPTARPRPRPRTSQAQAKKLARRIRWEGPWQELRGVHSHAASANTIAGTKSHFSWEPSWITAENSHPWLFVFRGDLHKKKYLREYAYNYDE